MKREVIVEVRSVYGESKTYPVSPMALEFARIAGTKTPTNATLASIQRMGFEVCVDGYNSKEVHGLRNWLSSLNGAA